MTLFICVGPLALPCALFQTGLRSALLGVMGSLLIFIFLSRPSKKIFAAAVIAALAEYLGVAKSHLAIIRGQTARIKTIEMISR